MATRSSASSTKLSLPTTPQCRTLAQSPAYWRYPSRASCATFRTAISLVALVRLPSCVLGNSEPSSLLCPSRRIHGSSCHPRLSREVPSVSANALLAMPLRESRRCQLLRGVRRETRPRLYLVRSHRTRGTEVLWELRQASGRSAGRAEIRVPGGVHAQAPRGEDPDLKG